jgi:hypothetical protein
MQLGYLTILRFIRPEAFRPHLTVSLAIIEFRKLSSLLRLAFTRRNNYPCLLRKIKLYLGTNIYFPY